MDLDVIAMRSLDWIQPNVLRVAESHGQSQRLISAGFPIEPRGRRFLSEFGGIVVPKPREMSSKRSWLETLIWVFPGWDVSRKPTLDELLAPLTDVESDELTMNTSYNYRLSFHSGHILHACHHDPTTVLYIVSDTVGSVLSIVGTGPNDDILLLSEAEETTYIYNFFGNHVNYYDHLDDALKAILIRPGWSGNFYEVRMAPDEYRWPPELLHPMLNLSEGTD